AIHAPKVAESRAKAPRRTPVASSAPAVAKSAPTPRAASPVTKPAAGSGNGKASKTKARPRVVARSKARTAG
ncbi:MAG: poly(3-hydroxyalkanoate) granule-associated protein PhaF, partial [Candidatus Dormibacteraeota bacterium]|nr:poly(3-hydroxyalkanoate) granule-associated protein PhaF [Candidatus Dormibacteraeota bacterium]